MASSQIRAFLRDDLESVPAGFHEAVPRRSQKCHDGLQSRVPGQFYRRASADRRFVDAKPAASASAAERSDVKKMIGEWPNRPKLGAQQMIAKYGEPQEATGERLVWHNQGPYKRILVTRQETPHDFPKPHMDYLEHTIAYRVPADKAGALTAYDGSATFDRTAGELSAKCDLEGHNILTLNLAHDVVTGKKDADGARKAFGEAVVQDAMGMNPADVTTLRVEPSKSAADAVAQHLEKAKQLKGDGKR